MKILQLAIIMTYLTKYNSTNNIILLLTDGIVYLLCMVLESKEKEEKACFNKESVITGICIPYWLVNEA